MLTTQPGFSSRSTDFHVAQLPQRDEATVSDMQPEAGFSNSDPVEGAPQDVHPDFPDREELEPGFSNAKAVAAEGSESKVVDDDSAEDKSVKAPAKKAAKKSAAKKG